MLSVYVPTYNHEKYIEKALDSILMQETTYSYEVLVGEDCSVDKTRKILQDYERTHPGKIKVFYREHNMYKEKINNAMDLINRCKGKYIIALEGDDFWISPYKIQKQVDFLENHPEYIAVSHDCIVVDKNSNPIKENYPTCKEKIYTYKHFASEIMPGQLTTIMRKNFNKCSDYDTRILQKKFTPGDRVFFFWMLMNGKMYCMHERMSAYRFVTDGGTSFSANYRYDFNNWNAIYECILLYSREKSNKDAEKYAEYLYLKNLLKGFKENQCSIKLMLKKALLIHHFFRSIFMYLKYRVNKNLLHREIWV